MHNVTGNFAKYLLFISIYLNRSPGETGWIKGVYGLWMSHGHYRLCVFNTHWLHRLGN